uniref:Calaxin n=1 Tax=Otolemur garnettii TaxID=30611 RepID=H0WWT7_OTOGA
MNRKKLQKLTDTLTKNCKHFNKFEVKCLIRLFYNLVGEGVERQGTVMGLDRNAFRNILHVTFGMTDDMIMDREFPGGEGAMMGCVNTSEHGRCLVNDGWMARGKETKKEGRNGGREVDGWEKWFHLKNKMEGRKEGQGGEKREGRAALRTLNHAHRFLAGLPHQFVEIYIKLNTFILQSQMEFEAQVFKDPTEFNDM